MDDDFNTPKALAALMTFARYTNPLIEKGEISKKTGEAVAAFLQSTDAIFGFQLFAGDSEQIPNEVQKLVELREQARKQKNWSESDRLRNEIRKLGYVIDDIPQGSRVKRV